MGHVTYRTCDGTFLTSAGSIWKFINIEYTVHDPSSCKYCYSKVTHNYTVVVSFWFFNILFHIPLYRYCRNTGSIGVWCVRVPIPRTNVNIKIPHETEGVVARCCRMLNDYRGSTHFVENQERTKIARWLYTHQLHDIYVNSVLRTTYLWAYTFTSEVWTPLNYIYYFT